jgi:predicted HD phosphohydrolase
MEKMHFTSMDQGTVADFEVLKKVHEHTLENLPNQLFALLENLAKDTAYNITRKEHCLQTATRALRDNKDDEYVV